ncbi:MAG: hypothetical protein ACLUVM_03470 [Blautia faecis]
MQKKGSTLVRISKSTLLPPGMNPALMTDLPDVNYRRRMSGFILPKMGNGEEIQYLKTK